LSRRSSVNRDDDFVAETRRQLPGEELFVTPCNHPTGIGSFHAARQSLENKYRGSNGSPEDAVTDSVYDRIFCASKEPASLER